MFCEKFVDNKIQTLGDSLWPVWRWRSWPGLPLRTSWRHSEQSRTRGKALVYSDV